MVAGFEGICAVVEDECLRWSERGGLLGAFWLHFDRVVKVFGDSLYLG